LSLSVHELPISQRKTKGTQSSIWGGRDAHLKQLTQLGWELT